MIKPQRYEAETDLSVDSAHAIVLNPVEKKYQERPCIKTITIVKKSLAGSDSAQGDRRNAKIGRQIMLGNAGHHFRMLLQKSLNV